MLMLKSRYILGYSPIAPQIYSRLFTIMASSSTADDASNSLTNIVKKLNAFAPLTLAESWDNVGLLIEPATPRYV